MSARWRAATLLAGAAGRALLAAFGLAAAIPFPLRLQRGLREDAPATPQPGIEQPSGHEQHS